MSESAWVGTPVRFGVFEADLKTGELRKHGLKIKLQQQPFQILVTLLERPGEVVTRQDLRLKLWPVDTHVDFYSSLKTAINKVREALGDSAENPRFIETLNRRGYRFIAPVSGMTPAIPPERGLTEEMTTELGRLHPRRLGVISRVSAMKYKHSGKGIDEIGRELGVDYILEGSVRCADERVRVNAQLIQVSNQTHLWADTFERLCTDTDVLTTQKQVARR